MKLLTLPVCVGAFFVQCNAMAHHSGTAMYDRESPVTITGTIARYEWANPHVYLYIEEETGSGDEAVWEIEGPPPALLRRTGWTEEMVQVGDRVTVNGLAGLNAARKTALMQTLTKADDTVLNAQLLRLMGSLPQADAAVTPSAASSLHGTWTTLLDIAALGPFMSPRPPFALTEKGQAAVASHVEGANSTVANCIPTTAPLLMLQPDIKSIEVSADVVTIRAEFDASERTIYMNVDSHVGATESIQGHSIGHWEGSALVIDTTHFVPHQSGIRGDVPSGPGKHLVERLELDEGGSRLTYTYSVEDSDYLAEPVMGSSKWAYRPDLSYEAPACDLDNARRFTEQRLR